MPEEKHKPTLFRAESREGSGVFASIFENYNWRDERMELRGQGDKGEGARKGGSLRGSLGWEVEGGLEIDN